MHVRVDPAALSEWAADARATGGRLGAAVAGVDGQVGALSHTWDGAAASEFARHYARWTSAARDLQAVLAAVVVLVDTASSSYASAATANAAIWDGGPTAGPAVIRPMVAAAPAARIDVQIADLRATVAALVHLTLRCGQDWAGLGAALSATGAMAGDDQAGAVFGHDADHTAVAAWQAWRSAAILLGATAGGLAETGNNVLRADRDSTPGAPAIDPIVADVGATPQVTPPPGAVGDNGSRSLVQPLADRWPSAAPDHLRGAAAAWRDAGGSAREVAGRTRSTVAALVAANPDPSLVRMREFTDRVLSDDPESGLLGVLAVVCGDMAGACDGLAGQVESTRMRMRDAVLAAVEGNEWVHATAAVLDALLTPGAAKVVAVAGDMLNLAFILDGIQDEHEAAVARIRAQISPAAADRLSRLATALVPPAPVGAATCAVTSPAGTPGAAVPEANRQALIAEVVASGAKISPGDVLQIARAPDGRVVWLERGQGGSGLSHILRADRIGDLLTRGVQPADIPGIAINAVTHGTPIGRVKGDGVAYDVDIGDGRREKIVVVVGSNGYVVTAYPLNRRATLRPM